MSVEADPWGVYGQRFPLEPLERALGARHGSPVSPSVVLLAARLGIGRRHLPRLRRTGLSEAQADVLAVRAGFHPGEVWPEWWTPSIVDEPEAAAG